MTERVGGIVLCGGRSTRIGHPKALLPFGPERMLDRVVGIVRGCVDPVVVVSAAGAAEFELPPRTLHAHDQRPGRGPLEGLLAGLKKIAPHASAAYATSCDVPLLAPTFVRALVGMLDEQHDVVVPAEPERLHPLAAVYRTCVVPVIERLLAADRLRPVYLFDEVRTRRVPVDELRAFDAELHSLLNVNRWEDYLESRRIAGLAPLDAEHRNDGMDDAVNM